MQQRAFLDWWQIRRRAPAALEATEGGGNLAEGPGSGPGLLELESESVSLDAMAGTVKRKSASQSSFKYH